MLPSTNLTWFRAAQACAVSGKRLTRNEEWQRAAAGTPDPGTDNGTTDCNISTAGGPSNTGSRSNCKSSWGVFDMVGNADEWVADWVDLADINIPCTDWTAQTGIAGGDFSCFGGNGSSSFFRIPGALVRGGYWADGTKAGVFAVSAFALPSGAPYSFGFRCAR